MTQDYAIGIGTVGAGLWMGYGGGEKWRHVQQGPPIEGNCRALAVDPARPERMWAAADRAGLFTSTDGGSRWEHHGPTLETDIWSIGLDPHDDDRIYLGVAPGILRSKDGGDTFDRLATSISDTCPIGTSRTTNVVVDPADPAVVWASVEVDGLHRSDDRGDTWASHGQIGPEAFHNDVHGLEVVDDGLLVTTPFGLGRSTDRGASFTWHEFAPFAGSKLGVAYSRCVRAPWDGVIVVCVGDFVPGRIGALEISRDGGTDVDARSAAAHTELDDVLVGHPSGGAGDDRRHLAVRARVRLRRPRRDVAQARPGVRRGAGRRGGADGLSAGADQLSSSVTATPPLGVTLAPGRGWPGAAVRARMPSVARRLVSEMTGKIDPAASRYASLRFDQS